MEGKEGLFSSQNDPSGQKELEYRLLSSLAAHVISGAAIEEEAFARERPSLHYEIRRVFGSYSRALTQYLKDPSRYLPAVELISEELRRLYRKGLSLNEAWFLKEAPLLGSAIMHVYGSLKNALEDAGLNPALALTDRNLTDDELFLRARACSAALRNRIGREWEKQDVVLIDAIGRRFHTLTEFFSWFDGLLRQNTQLMILHQRKKLSSYIIEQLPVASRGVVGRRLPVAKPDRVFACRSNHVWVFFADGLVQRMPADWITPVEAGQEGVRLGFVRSGKVVAVINELAADENLLLVSEKGRTKIVQREDLKHFKAEGNRCMGLEGNDSLSVAQALKPGDGPVAVFTRRGRGFRIDADALRMQSRQARGVLMLKTDSQQDAPVAAFRMDDGDSCVLADPQGHVKVVEGGDIPVRSNRGLGVICSRDGLAAAYPVVGARVGLVSRGGRLALFPVEEVRALSRLSRGPKGIELQLGDRVDSLFTF